ncbi:MAG: DEAD/DEAH box helicase family protein [Ruminiclostridium sp.]|nr:DEAD/DEAH box helicase family protein [Ruminiclostridium sp.]
MTTYNFTAPATLSDTPHITVVDAPCGAGKTSWAIDEMDRNPHQRYIFCTPFLEELKRIIRDSKVHCFVQPLNFEKSKLEHFEELLAQKRDIVVTHSTFLNATPRTMELMRAGNYILILDEALDTVADFNRMPAVEEGYVPGINTGDVRILLNGNQLRVGEKGKAEWIGGDCGKSNFDEAIRLARLGNLYVVRESAFAWVLSPEMFRLFSQVYVLTYLFDGTTLKSYFDLMELSYRVVGIRREGEALSLVEHSPAQDLEFRRAARELITIFDSPKLTYGWTELSKNWYKRNNTKKSKAFAEMRGHLRYFFRKVAKASAALNEIMWTCPTEFKEKLKGKGYISAAPITAEEKKENTPQGLKELEKKRSCFVPCNAKATNDFGERWALAYCCNIFYLPMLEGLFTDNGVVFDEERFALSCLVQWVWRSRIRNGKPIHLYIPSLRMREIFRAWLFEE